MDLQNGTRYPAAITRMVYRDDRIAASVLVRVTYDIVGGVLRPSEDQPWIVSPAPWEGPRGLMDGDCVFYKGGTDVMVYGRAVAEGGRPVREMDVEVRIGSEFHRRVRVLGPRVWYRGALGLVATDPHPFTEIPLTLEHAYGGKDIWDGLEIPYQDNPEGRGFYLSEASAVDKPLPSIEEVDQRITRWDDRPAPAGLVHCPTASPLRLRNGVEITPAGRPQIRPQLFNAAFPAMIAPKVQPKDAVLLTGMSAAGPIAFSLPDNPFLVRLRFGEERHENPPIIDQVGIEVDLGRVFIAYRYPFRYIVHEMQERECVLVERDGAS